MRYGERLARSRGDLGEVIAALDEAWFIREFYGPWLDAFWKEPAATHAAAGSPLLVLITIPFPGCLAGALACARTARASLGEKAVIVFGGGYVSTELRGLSDPRLFDYCDYLSFDSGYGSLASIIERTEGKAVPLYRSMRRSGGQVLAEGFETEAPGGAGELARFADEERKALGAVFPDYRDVDFSRYLCAMDSDNAMHRLWSDTPWLKYSLAHGCYWARCAFCDTQLDYVSNYVPASIGPLMAAVDAAGDRSGLHGIHFVDEAMPMSRLLAFAAANRARAASGGRPFSFWGNVRFDASWTAGRCDYLAASGLVAVSGGIEISRTCPRN